MNHGHWPPDSPNFLLPLSLARTTLSPGWRRKVRWPTAPPSRRRETTFSSTAGSFQESSTRDQSASSTATSAIVSRTTRAFSSISGTTPAKVVEQSYDSTASPASSRTSKSRAPMAAYRHVRKPYDTVGSLLIQHGSYQWISLRTSRTSKRERSCFIGVSGRRHHFPLPAIPAGRSLVREPGNLAKVSAHPGSYAV